MEGLAELVAYLDSEDCAVVFTDLKVTRRYEVTKPVGWNVWLMGEDGTGVIVETTAIDRSLTQASRTVIEYLKENA